MKHISKSELDLFANNVNSFILKVKNQPYVPLGPQYTSMFDTDAVERNLALHRINKKFCVPSGSNNLTDVSINKMLEYDRNTKFTEFCPARTEMDDDVRRLLYRVRAQLHENFGNFRLGDTPLVLPSGESDVPTKGDCSVYARLKNPKQWRVTADCFDLVSGIIYRTPGLKSSAREHFLPYNKEENYLLWFALGDKYEIFKCKLLDFVTIVPGSRISTVPKNNDEERVINCEPFLNMVSQLYISAAINKKLAKEPYHYTKERTQEIHRSMISDLSKCTIDLSKASDSNWLSVIKWLYPKRFFNLVNGARSPVGSRKGAQHTFNMLSPMGNGFTFEVMTTTLLAFCRDLDPTSSVYGDDIVISKEHSDLLTRLLSTIGFVLNDKKTFTHGYFRESCGAFYHKDRYLKSYDLEYCVDALDGVVSLNKLIELRHILGIESELRTFIKSSCPPILLMEGNCATRDKTILDGHIRVPLDLMNVRRFKRKRQMWTRSIPRFKRLCLDDITSWCYDHRSVDFYINLNRVSHTYVSTGKWKGIPRKNLTNRHLINAYLYSGRCTAPVLKNKTFLTGDLVVY